MLFIIRSRFLILKQRTTWLKHTCKQYHELHHIRKSTRICVLCMYKIKTILFFSQARSKYKRSKYNNNKNRIQLQATDLLPNRAVNGNINWYGVWKRSEEKKTQNEERKKQMKKKNEIHTHCDTTTTTVRATAKKELEHATNIIKSTPLTRFFDQSHQKILSESLYEV